jgi:hypothetical protein
LKGASEFVAAIAILGVAIAAISLYIFVLGGISSGSMPGNPSLLVTASEFTRAGSTYYASIRVSAIGSKAIIKALELYDPRGRNISIEAIYPEPLWRFPRVPQQRSCWLQGSNHLETMALNPRSQSMTT